ncbi:hypothetical protein TNCV_171461 [Trichonephila clavipes]|nr:hypothetical protein TNCV_171461 [Trichonephila clavipes]
MTRWPRTRDYGHETTTAKAVGSLAVRASEDHQIPSEYMLVKSEWVRKSCGRSQRKPRMQGADEYFPPL